MLIIILLLLLHGVEGAEEGLAEVKKVSLASSVFGFCAGWREKVRS